MGLHADLAAANARIAELEARLATESRVVAAVERGRANPRQAVLRFSDLPEVCQSVVTASDLGLGLDLTPERVGRLRTEIVDLSYAAVATSDGSRGSPTPALSGV
jgi:hypothetical protein